MAHEPDDPDPILDTVELEPEQQPADASVIWMHGLGADGYDFEPVVPQLGLPPDLAVRFVFPHAPAMPVSLNFGMVMPAWFDVLSLDPKDRQDEEGIRRAGTWIERLVERERRRGVEPGRVVLAGFSQGGAVALHVGLRYPERLAGLLVLSTFLVLPDELEAERSEANRDVPILQGHGTLDPMVAESRGREACDRLRSLGYSVEYQTWPMQHQVCLEEIQLAGQWIGERLAG